MKIGFIILLLFASFAALSKNGAKDKEDKK